MSNQLDERIRELFVELDQASPEEPPMPARPVPAKAPLWTRALVPATGVVMVVLVLGVVSQLVFSGDSDQGSVTTISASADAAETTTPVGTRSPDHALALARLNLSCSAFIDDSAIAVPLPPRSSQELFDAIVALEPPVAALVDSVMAAEGDLDDPRFAPIVEAAEDIETLVAGGVAGPAEDAVETYVGLVVDIGRLGFDLADYGALDCSGLESGLP